MEQPAFWGCFFVCCLVGGLSSTCGSSLQRRLLLRRRERPRCPIHHSSESARALVVPLIAPARQRAVSLSRSALQRVSERSRCPAQASIETASSLVVPLSPPACQRALSLSRSPPPNSPPPNPTQLKIHNYAKYGKLFLKSKGVDVCILKPHQPK